MTLPTIFVGKDQLDMWIEDPNNRGIENWKYTMLEDTLPDAIKKAAEIAGSDKVVLYDGSFGFLNCSRSAAEDSSKTPPRSASGWMEVLYLKY